MPIYRWLNSATVQTQDQRYTHRLVTEDRAHRDGALPDLKDYFLRAHQDAREMLAAMHGISLDPEDRPSNFVIDNYPGLLDTVTLQGYFGEILSGLVAEYFSPFGIDWEVPAFLMRFHMPAFQALERARQTGQIPGIIPGRTGDDCVAFERDSEGRIIRSLICEAKCTLDHNASLIRVGHVKISEPNITPVDLAQLIDILSRYTEAESQQWVQSLRQLLLHVPRNYERCDMLTYVCGRAPVTRYSWIPHQQPHGDYSANRRFEVTEIHFVDSVVDLIDEVYERRGHHGHTR